MPDRQARPRFKDLTWLVALGAALWGTDAFFRRGVLGQAAPATVVFAEHLVLVILMLPVLPRAIAAFSRSPVRIRWAIVAIGAGASAVATALFTFAFKISSSHGDFTTPVVVQHLQPLIAISLAVVVLKERLRGRFALFVIPCLIGVWLLAFPHPLALTLSGFAVVLLALGAAALWAAGTVFGRLVTSYVGATELTALRFLFGLPAAALIVLCTGDPFWVPGLSASFSLLGLVLVPSLLALTLYYSGLRRTPASRATLAELAFPLTGAVLGTWLGSPLTVSQWVGVAVVAGSVTALSWHEARSRDTAVTSFEPALGPATV
ncbi:MAG: DMT family transporter [Nakamurella sp.]